MAHFKQRTLADAQKELEQLRAQEKQFHHDSRRVKLTRPNTLPTIKRSDYVPTPNAPLVVTLPPGGIALVEIEKQAILAALQKCSWVQKDAAAYLRISPRVMSYKVRLFFKRKPE